MVWEILNTEQQHADRGIFKITCSEKLYAQRSPDKTLSCHLRMRSKLRESFKNWRDDHSLKKIFFCLFGVCFLLVLAPRIQENLSNMNIS